MRVPSATYRVQFNADFRFSDAGAIVPHLHRLGISHLYASPIFAARKGSTHGYDVTDPGRINPDLGTPEELDALVASLQERGMGLILDIVPNHMAASPENRWWMDVLENGSASRYAGHFGINWGSSRANVKDKIFLPILGSTYGKVLESGELKLSCENGSFYVNYWERKLPVNPSTWDRILRPGCQPLLELPDVQMLFEMLERLPTGTPTEWEALERRESEKENIRRRIAELHEAVPEFHEHVANAIACLNGTPGQPETFEALHAILEDQAWRLAWYMVGRDRINYRRFFDVSDLIGLRVESDEVFRDTHALVLDLVQQGKVDGLRVDHIDGLNDPLGYLEKLPHDMYTVVEKILVGEERLPATWPVQGTTGYDFLGYSNALFVSPEGLARLDWLFREVIGFDQSFGEVEYDRKKQALRELFPGEMADLGANLSSLAEYDWFARDFSPRDITRSLREITACLPVYRTYTRDAVVSDADRACVARAKQDALARSAGVIDSQVFDFVERVLTLRFPRWLSDDLKEEWIRFVRQWQQISGPVMAKGVEDSTFYVYNRLLSQNEVGGLQNAVSVEEMHAFLSERARDWPATMNGSSTHDTKRSEDVRARLNVLAEIPDEWIRAVTRWRRIVKHRKGPVDDNEEYFIYQNLMGAWPLQPEEVPAFRERFHNYLIKAAREARTYSTWLQPSIEHEEALQAFAGSLFEDERFQSIFQPLFERVVWYGAINSLSSLLLKTTSPGLPDFYRGTISWDFSLVDPDNRRPVDFAPLTDFAEAAKNLLTHWRDGRVKIYLTEKALGFRKGSSELYERGEYIPLEVTGRRAGHVFAFARRLGGQYAITVVPRFTAQLSSATRLPVGQRIWQDTELVLPDDAPVRWKNIITSDKLSAGRGRLPLARILSQFPAALLSGTLHSK